MKNVSKLSKLIYEALNIEYEGFSKIEYNWADYMCGMGVCCDPYAVGFVLPEDNYDDYLFKLVDSDYYDDDGDYPRYMSDDLPEDCYNFPNIENPKFDSIVMYEDLYRKLNTYFGDMSVWKESFIFLFNEIYKTKVTDIIPIY